jgi:hypothetical protein
LDPLWRNLGLARRVILDGAAENSVVVIQSGVLAQDAADGAAEPSVVVANPELKTTPHCHCAGSYIVEEKGYV